MFFQCKKYKVQIFVNTSGDADLLPLLASRRYMDELMRQKAAAAEQGCDYLTWNDIQACIDQVNLAVQEEHERKEALQFCPLICLVIYVV